VEIRILGETLARLESLYKKEKLNPGVLVKVGLKPGWNVVIGTEGQCGMAMSFTNSTESFGKPSLNVPRLQSFIKKDLFEVAAYSLKSESWQERAIGVAAMSALSQPLLTPDQLSRRGFKISAEPGGMMSLLKPEDIVAIVGYGGAISRMTSKCKELHVTDMRPRAAFQALVIGDRIEYAPRRVFVYTEQENKEVFGKATLVIITGSSLVNGTFEELMSYRRNPRLTVMYGSSVSLIPDVFFEEGVDFINSYRVSDPARFEDGMLNEMNIEQVVHSTQQSQMIGRQA
jgi:uncharacterized protein